MPPYCRRAALNVLAALVVGCGSEERSDPDADTSPAESSGPGSSSGDPAEELNAMCLRAESCWEQCWPEVVHAAECLHAFPESYCGEGEGSWCFDDCAQTLSEYTVDKGVWQFEEATLDCYCASYDENGYCVPADACASPCNGGVLGSSETMPLVSECKVVYDCLNTEECLDAFWDYTTDPAGGPIDGDSNFERWTYQCAMVCGESVTATDPIGEGPYTRPESMAHQVLYQCTSFDPSIDRWEDPMCVDAWTKCQFQYEQWRYES